MRQRFSHALVFLTIGAFSGCDGVYSPQLFDSQNPDPPLPPVTYTVGGTVSGLSGTVALLNNGGDGLSVSADGGFTFATALADGAGYAVTIETQPAGQTCEVAGGTGTISGADVTDVAVTCVDDPPPPPVTTVSYASDVQPYFNAACTVCHSGANPAGSVDLASYAGVMGSSVVVPGDADASVLVQQLEGGHRNQLQADIDMIRTWIQEGAQDN
jgi:hypothetical protein